VRHKRPAKRVHLAGWSGAVGRSNVRVMTSTQANADGVRSCMHILTGFIVCAYDPSPCARVRWGDRVRERGACGRESALLSCRHAPPRAKENPSHTSCGVQPGP
jgi:hypothetical protein